MKVSKDQHLKAERKCLSAAAAEWSVTRDQTPGTIWGYHTSMFFLKNLGQHVPRKISMEFAKVRRKNVFLGEDGVFQMKEFRTTLISQMQVSNWFQLIEFVVSDVGFLTRGNLQNIKTWSPSSAPWNQEMDAQARMLFFFGGGERHMIFFHQNSQGVVLVNSRCVITLHCDGKINPLQWYTTGLHSREWVSISHETFAQLFTLEGDMLVPRRVRLPIFQEIEAVQAFRSFVKEFIWRYFNMKNTSTKPPGARA